MDELWTTYIVEDEEVRELIAYRHEDKIILRMLNRDVCVFSKRFYMQIMKKSDDLYANIGDINISYKILKIKLKELLFFLLEEEIEMR